jgi:hypothetical protein
MKEKYQHITDDGEIINERMRSFPDSINEHGYRLPAHKDGIRMFKDAPFPKEMTYADKGRFADLCKLYLIGESGILGCASKSGPRAFNATAIGEIVGLNPRRAQAWVKKMCHLRVFHKLTATDGSAQYWVNPAYALKGGYRVDFHQFITFRKEMVPLMTPGAVAEMNRRCSTDPMLKCEITEEAERIVNGT